MHHKCQKRSSKKNEKENQENPKNIKTATVQKMS